MALNLLQNLSTGTFSFICRIYSHDSYPQIKNNCCLLVCLPMHTHAFFFNKYFVVCIYSELLLLFYSPLKIIKCFHKYFTLFNTHSPSLNFIHLMGKLRPGRKCHGRHHNIGRWQMKDSYLSIQTPIPACSQKHPIGLQIPITQSASSFPSPSTLPGTGG